MNQSLRGLARFIGVSVASLATLLGANARGQSDASPAPIQRGQTLVAAEKVVMKDPFTSFEQGLSRGSWGGEHISLEITENGGNVEFDCAHGTLTQKIMPDRLGRFEVAGIFEEEHGGPVRAGAATHSLAVRYVGQVKAGTLTLNIRRRDNRKLIGTFKLKQGAEAFLVKCR